MRKQNTKQVRNPRYAKDVLAIVCWPAMLVSEKEEEEVIKEDDKMFLNSRLLQM